MVMLTIEKLAKIIENVPGEYEVEYYDSFNNISHTVSGKVEIDVDAKKLVLKS